MWRQEFARLSWLTAMNLATRSYVWCSHFVKITGLLGVYLCLHVVLLFWERTVTYMEDDWELLQEPPNKKEWRLGEIIAEEQRLLLAAVSSRSAFTCVGIAGLCARMIAAKAETEKPLFWRREGSPYGCSFSLALLFWARESSDVGPRLLSRQRQSKTYQDFLCSSSASSTMKLWRMNSPNLQRVSNELLSVHFVLEVAPFTIQLMRAVSSNAFQLFCRVTFKFSPVSNCVCCQ